jgi:hypothetical protein
MRPIQLGIGVPSSLERAAMNIFGSILILVRAFFGNRIVLAAENLALRQQLAVLHRSVKRPKLRKRDRIFWVWLSRLWKDWRSSLLVVQPATVVRLHRQGFKLCWRWKSRLGKPRRPKIDQVFRDLIRRMSHENPLWGAPRIQSEMRLLGYDIAKSTVERYLARSRKPSSPTWRGFLQNHISEIAAIDFFTVTTVAFRLLYCFIVLRHDRRRVVHFNVTSHPTARWTAQQVVDAFPFDEAPRFLIRDRDGFYGLGFVQRVKHMCVEEVIIAYRSPWQSPYVERLVGSIRRECLDHFIVLNETHLLRILSSYFEYYHESRTHLSLARNAPLPRKVELPCRGRIVSTPQVGGLHHRYSRAA